MYASIRRYRTDSSHDVNRLVKKDFVPLISRQPGFMAYYGIDTGDGYWAAVNIFETQAQAEESNRIAADYVRKHLSSFMGTAEITAGKVIAFKMSEAGRKAA